MKLHIRWANDQTRTWDLPGQYLGATRNVAAKNGRPAIRHKTALLFSHLDGWNFRHGRIGMAAYYKASNQKMWKLNALVLDCRVYSGFCSLPGAGATWGIAPMKGHQAKPTNKHERAQNLVKHRELHTSFSRLDCISESPKLGSEPGDQILEAQDTNSILFCRV